MTAAQAQQGVHSKQLAACAFWLQEHARFDNSYRKLIELHTKENRKARPSEATKTALFDGARAAHTQINESLEVIHRRGGLLFVGAAGALRAAAQLRGGEA
ncbi:hypothetical protein [Alicycliphilus denitrificans]|uniref:hypothetical protein n=1 Tax=Alicycliphilus denitrificans TaxID=179636 RepID=UPI0001DA0DEC|nr:hypothetical protein [Alicycliphilus denitrificans]ADV01288.1 hypothetical protein Alide_3571 [Alicycliphilus denitrificans BC]